MRNISRGVKAPLAACALVLLGLGGCMQARDPSVELHGRKFAVEIADTDAARRQGLMNRERLEAGHGMLFVYQEPEIMRFWMMNTHMPLDILFFDDHVRLVDIHRDAQPCFAEPCARYYSHVLAKYALELPAGTAGELGVAPGDTLLIHR